MAKIKIKINSNEIEIDSRDLDINNKNMHEIIEDIHSFILDNINQHNKLDSISNDTVQFKKTAIIDDPKPTFDEPVVISPQEIKSKLHFLEKQSFFDIPHTVNEIVNQFHEYGWISNSLDVSKELIKMVFNKELLKNFHDERFYYFVKKPLLSN